MSQAAGPYAASIHGTVMPGHGVASGRADNSPYPQSSLAMQMPFFKAMGLDLSGCWPGTLNVSIAPRTWALERANYCFERLMWTHLHPPETFSFVHLQLTWQKQTVPAWLCYPHPETKAAHYQAATVMEVLAPRLEGLKYGETVRIALPTSAILLST